MFTITLHIYKPHIHLCHAIGKNYV